MSDIHIKNLIGRGPDKYSQSQLAKMLGISQSAVSQIIRSGRGIYLRFHNGMYHSHYEIKHSNVCASSPPAPSEPLRESA